MTREIEKRLEETAPVQEMKGSETSTERDEKESENCFAICTCPMPM